jgi:hypothetical protein
LQVSPRVKYVALWDLVCCVVQASCGFQSQPPFLEVGCISPEFWLPRKEFHFFVGFLLVLCCLGATNALFLGYWRGFWRGGAGCGA